jgi:sugar lactone lactonase YvrE
VLILAILLLALPASTAAQTAVFSYAQTIVGAGFSYPAGVAVDKSGNVYVADSTSGDVYEIPPGCITVNCVKTLGSGFVTPSGVAVDGSGDVFVADLSNNTVKEMLAVSGSIPASPTINTLGSGFSFPVSVAVDASGDVFVADSHNKAVKEMVAVGGVIPASPTINTLGGGFSFGNPQGVALDASGDVFIADWTNDAAYEIPSGCTTSSCVKTLATGFNEPQGIAVDGNGNVYVADTGNSELKEVVAVGGSIPASPSINILLSGLNFPYGVAVNGSGNIFLGVAKSSQVLELDTGVMNFGKVPVGQTSPVDSLTATFAVSGYSGSFTPTIVAHYGKDYSVGAVSCTTTSVGENCSVTVTFQPTLPGGRKDALFVMNGTTRMASVLMGGVGLAPLSLVQPGVVTNINPTATYYQYNSTVDENGTVYVLSSNSPSGSNVFSITKAGVVSTVPVTVTSPNGIVIDGAGVLYIAQNTYSYSLVTYDTVQNKAGTLCIVPPTFGYSCTSSSNDEYLYDVANDAFGNLFVLDIESLNQNVIELTPSGNYVLYPAAGNPGPSLVAVDANDNVFLAGGDMPGTGNPAIEKIVNNVQTSVNTTGTGEGIAFDAAETLYATRYYVAPYDVAMLAASNYETPLAGIDGGVSSEIESPLGLSLGSDGTLYVGNYTYFDKVDRTQGAIAFGEQSVNVASTAQAVGIYNGGNQNLTLSSLGVSGTGFAMTPAATNGCTASLVIAPGQLCDVEVTATFPHAGTFSGTVTFTTNSLNTTSTTQTVNLTGFVYGPYVTTAQSAAFGNVNVGTQPTMTVTLTNSGDLYSAGLSFGTATVPTGFTLSGGTGTGSCGAAGDSLAPGASCAVTITFSPTQVVSYGGTVSIPVSSSGGGGPWPAVTFAASGAGITSAPAVSITPSSYVFPAVTVESGYQSGNGNPAITLTNIGTAPLTFSGSTPFTIVNGGTNSPITVYPNGSCTLTYVDFATSLPAGDSCTITVQFFPQSAGAFQAELSVADNAANSPQTIALSGVGQEGQLQYNPGLLTFIAGSYGNPGEPVSGAQASSSAIASGRGIVTDRQGNLYFSDLVYNTVWEVNLTSGVISTLAGAPGAGSYSGDGKAAASAGLNSPMQLAFGGAGNLYIADRLNNVVRMVNTSGVISTFAGKQGAGSYGGDGGPATSANLNGPQGVAVDALGNVYIADTGNNIIRKVDTTGKITLFAGTPNKSGTTVDGVATSALLGTPYQVATDLAGNVYIADNGNLVISQVNSSGHIFIYAGGGSAAVTTTPQLATGVSLLAAEGVATDPAGDVYIADGNRAYRVDTGENITLFAGGGTLTTSGNPATSTGVGATALALDTSGDLFVQDSSNDVVYEVGPQGDLVFGSTNVSSTSAVETITLINTGNAPVNFYNPNNEGAAPGAPHSAAAVTRPLSAAAVTEGGTVGNGVGTVTGDFAIAPGGTCDLSTSVSIGAGGSCTLNVTFSPTQPGVSTGNITLYADGPYDIPAVIQLSGTGVSSLTAQAINFTQPTSPVTYSPGLQISLVATGGASGNPVVFTIDSSSSGAGSITGSTLTVTGVGSFVIDANQAGNATYSAAPQVQRTVVVTQAAQAINFTQPTTPVTYSSGLQIPLVATGGASGNPVVFTIDTSSTGTGNISGTMLTVTSTGNLVIDANQTGNTNYSAAPQVQRTIVVNALIAQAISFTQPTSPVTYSSTLQIPLVATGGASGNAVVFTLDSSSTGTGSITGSTLTATGVGSLVIDANQAGNATYSAAPQVQRTVVVNQAPQAINFTQPTSPVVYSSGLQISLSATGGASGNAVVFTIDSSSTGKGSLSGSTLTVTGAGNLVIDANQAGNADYSLAPQVQRTIVVTTDFTVSATPTSQSIQGGASAQYSITVTSDGGSFSSPVMLSVTGLPVGATDSFSTNPVTPGSANGTSTLTITTAAVANLVPRNVWPFGTPVLALLFMLPFRRWRRVWRGKLLLLLVGLSSLAGAVSLMGCGAGFGMVARTQTYTLTITGTSGTDTHSTTVQLTVQ